MPPLRRAWLMFNPAWRSAWTSRRSWRSGRVRVAFAWVAPWLSQPVIRFPLRLDQILGGRPIHIRPTGNLHEPFLQRRQTADLRLQGLHLARTQSHSLGVRRLDQED